MASLLTSTIILEGITHIEDLSIDKFIHAVEDLKNKVVTEKLDGANLWFGIDDKGFFTSREGKSSKGDKSSRFYSVSDYPMVANYNGFRAAHLALQKVEQTIKRHLSNGQMVETEILFGRQPNTVTYGNSDKNFIVILRGIDTDQKRVDALANALDSKTVSVTSTIISSDDGDVLKKEDQTLVWDFTQVKPVDTKEIDTKPALELLAQMKKYARQKNAKVGGKTNQEVAEISLTSVDKDNRPAVKAEREAQLAYIMKTYKEPIKEILLHTFVRKVKPFLQRRYPLMD